MWCVLELYRLSKYLPTEIFSASQAIQTDTEKQGSVVYVGNDCKQSTSMSRRCQALIAEVRPPGSEAQCI